MNPSFTTTQIARHSYVVGKTNEIDAWMRCPTCQNHNRIRLRLGPSLAEQERITCNHFVEYSFKGNPKERVVYFTFGVG